MKLVYTRALGARGAIRGGSSPLSPTVKKIIITKENSGQRIDKFLAVELFSYTRGEIIRMIKNGEIKVNGKNIKPSYALKERDKISVKRKTKSEKLIPNDNIEVKIIYKDENIIVVDKPAGIKVHPSSFEEDDTLVNFLIAKFPEIKNVSDGSPGSDLRSGIAHRLDKDTSGIMIVARNQKAFSELKRLFQERKIEKKYLALVFGKLKDKKGIIIKPIARAGNYKKQVIAGRKTKTKIREAVTEYKVIKEFDNYSLVEVVPKTGRMHQIRVHFFSLGNPIVGDKIYKLKSKVQPFSSSRLILNAKRQLLHSESIKFELKGNKYSFQSEIPDDFINFLRNLD